jgi:hypothetical protein
MKRDVALLWLFIHPPDRAAHLTGIRQSALRRDRERRSSANRIQLFKMIGETDRESKKVIIS